MFLLKPLSGQHLLGRIRMPVPDFSTYRILSNADAYFDANDKQNRIIIGWYRIPLDEHFIYFRCSPNKIS